MNLMELVREAGVVGAGGAGFPTHVKLAARVDTVLANGAECEPLLYSDQFVMESYAEEIVDGLRHVMRQTGASRGLLCVKEKYHNVIARFEKLIAGEKGMELFLLGNFYPSGDEQVLVYETTGRIVPEAGLPLNVGVVVQNVATLANIARAAKGEAVTDKIITVGGEIKNPGVHRVPLGASLAGIIAGCGGPLLDDYAVLLNGPMMGRLADPAKEAVTKTTSGLFILPKENPHVARLSRPLAADIRLSRGACEQCRYCTDLCPRSLNGHALEPHAIMRVINEQREPEAATVLNAFLCCECGVCDLFACPIALSPRRFFRDFKRSLSERGIRFTPEKKELKADVYREVRRVPKDKLTRRLALSKYEIKPPYHGARWDMPAVNLPLSMHLGAPALPLVKAGDKVKRGQKIGSIPEGKLGAAIHASIAGTVTKVHGFIRIEQ